MYKSSFSAACNAIVFQPNVAMDPSIHSEVEEVSIGKEAGMHWSYSVRQVAVRLCGGPSTPTPCFADHPPSNMCETLPRSWKSLRNCATIHPLHVELETARSLEISGLNKLGKT